ncbi:hypothetical protein, partial [Klebsiella pneumoniae]|uniref:hypothetical protein n=1 Tax=Klebsiella pneumoniae TaxID=573 RepID=UPI001951031D
VSTRNDGEWIAQVYRSIQCPAGSAWEGRCDPSRGSVVAVGSSTFPFVPFELVKRSSRLASGGLPAAVPSSPRGSIAG